MRKFFLSLAAFICLSTGCSDIKKENEENKDSTSITVINQPCDLNSDGICDQRDYALFLEALGHSDKEDKYNELADADNDGYVTEKDGKELFPSRFLQTASKKTSDQ